jgi:hypothetical protein
MTREEAKFLLRAYRPDGQDAGLPEFARALEWVDQDPELKQWFESENAFDRAMVTKVNQEKVPEDLLASILVANKVARPPRTAWTLGGVKWAVAVVFAGAILMTALKGRGNDDLAPFRSDVMAHLKVPGHQFDFEAKNFSELKSWMDARDVKMDVGPIDHLTSLPTHGCKIMDWGGQIVTLICFELPDRRNVHLFVFHEMQMADPKGLEEPLWQEEEGWTTVGWTTGSDLFMLAGQIPKQDLRQYL